MSFVDFSFKQFSFPMGARCYVWSSFLLFHFDRWTTQWILLKQRRKYSEFAPRIMKCQEQCFSAFFTPRNPYSLNNARGIQSFQQNPLQPKSNVRHAIHQHYLETMGFIPNYINISLFVIIWWEIKWTW